MTQLRFSDIPASRTTDPATSAAAVANHHGREPNAQRVYFAVSDNPGMTYREIANATGMDPVEVMRRLNDLHRKGLIVKGPERACKTNGHKMTTWTTK